MLINKKKGDLSKKEYTAKYYDMMRKSYSENLKRWRELLNKERVSLNCYCNTENFCHRFLLVEMLVKTEKAE